MPPPEVWHSPYASSVQDMQVIFSLDSSPAGRKSAVAGDPVVGRTGRRAVVSSWSVSLLKISFRATAAGAAKML